MSFLRSTHITRRSFLRWLERRERRNASRKSLASRAMDRFANLAKMRMQLWTSNRERKLDLMVQARRAGWLGCSYRTAKKFDRKLTRREAQASAARRAAFAQGRAP